MKLYPINVILCKCTKEGRELFMPGPETITKLLKEGKGRDFGNERCGFSKGTTDWEWGGEIIHIAL